MPATRTDSPMSGTYDPNSFILNRLNIQLARSQAILNSWHTSKQQSAKDEGETDAPENDDDFKSFGEKGGIGSMVKDDDDSALLTRRSAHQDKLLEQLIGRKAASAKRKQDAQRSATGPSRAAWKPVAPEAKQQKRREESESEEEEGRAAAFGRKRSQKAPGRQGALAEDETGTNGVEEIGNEGAATPQDFQVAEDKSQPKPGPKAQKRKAGGSYLDELLSKKAKKKSKKKQKG